MNSPIGIASLFKEEIFCIPDYEWGYAWQRIINRIFSIPEEMTDSKAAQIDSLLTRGVYGRSLIQP